LITLFLVEEDYCQRLFCTSALFFEATRRDYYDRLLASAREGNGRADEYFLNGVARQAEDALSRAERINRLIQEWQLKQPELVRKQRCNWLHAWQKILFSPSQKPPNGLISLHNGSERLAKARGTRDHKANGQR